MKKDAFGKINIIDLKNEIEVNKLSLDEKYAYEMLTTEVTKDKILIWKNKVKEEYYKYNFSKEHKTNSAHYIMFLYIVLIAVAAAVALISDFNTIAAFMACMIPIVFFLLLGNSFVCWNKKTHVSE